MVKPGGKKVGLNVSGIGIIAIVCHHCHAKLYWYVIGDESNRNKFSGPPVPSKALAGYDNSECPMCGARLRVKRPMSVKIMTRKEFEENYIVTRYQLVRKTTIVEEQLKQTALHGLPTAAESTQAETF